MLAPKETNEDLALPDDACPVLNVGKEKEIGMQGLEKKNNSVNEVEGNSIALFVSFETMIFGIVFVVHGLGLIDWHGYG